MSDTNQTKSVAAWRQIRVENRPVADEAMRIPANFDLNVRN